MKAHWYLVLILGWALAGPAWAQKAPTLSVRMVTASQQERAEEPRLRDVLPLLKTMKFASFVLDGEYKIGLREGSRAALAKGYVLTLTQVQGKKATVNVTRKRKRVVQTKLSLRKGRPVLVGGFDDASGGKTIIVLKLQ